MKYKRFEIKKYKGVVESVLPIRKTPVPIIGVNESGKSSALEAVTQFDYRNDELTVAKQWKFLNRYKPKEKEFEVVAEIGISQSEVDELLTELFPPELVEAALPEADEATEEDPEEAQATEPTEVIPDHPKITVINNALKVSRIFESTGQEKKYYKIEGIEGYEDETQKIVKACLNRLPRLYYVGDFLERHLPNEVDFSSFLSDPLKPLTEHQKIIAGAFIAADISLKDCLEHKDSITRNTWTKSVSKKMTDLIIEEWNRMHVGGSFLDVKSVSDVRVELALSENRKKFSIIIYEQFTHKDEEFPEISTPLNERSLGFRWFFNFSAIKCFGAIENEEFVYLLDEPGSFLHNSAQTVLVEAIKDLAKQHPVIYATHSEFLLNPEQININDIRVVQKENHEIKLIPYAETREKKHAGALSTLNNALRRNIPLEPVNKNKVIVTEGITDFYAWKPLVDVVYLPGIGAGNNKYLLSIAIGSASKYIGLFDGDDAGDRAMTQYKGYFDENEAVNWTQYTDATNKPVKLEQLFSENDKKRLLAITGHSSVKSAFGILFHDVKTDEFWKDIDSETRKNIQKNISNIAERLSLTDKQLNFGFKK